MIKSKTKYAVLGALSLKPMSGYEIKKMMANSTNYFWSESNGQLYPTLNKLAKDKLVTCEKDTSKKVSRKVYALTEAGIDELKKWLESSFDYEPARNELLLKLFYGKNVDPDISIKHIKQHLDTCQSRIGIFKDIEKNLLEKLKHNKDVVYFLVTVQSGINIVEAQIKWCEASIKLIKTTYQEVDTK